jgi:tRNA dimethylallyltransferase
MMFRTGLRKEVDELSKRYDWQNEAMSGIGYREFEDYYYHRASIGRVKRNIVQHTLELAKRQRTWFKRNPDIKWFSNTTDAKAFILSQV